MTFARKHTPRVRVYPSAIPESQRRTAVFARMDAPAAPIDKGQKSGRGADEKQHKDRLARLGCMVCRRLFGAHDPGPVELHHLRTGGWGRGDYLTLIPLCPEHHRGKSGVHGLGTKAFDRHYPFTQADLLADALNLI